MSAIQEFQDLLCPSNSISKGTSPNRLYKNILNIWMQSEGLRLSFRKADALFRRKYHLKNGWRPLNYTINIPNSQILSENNNSWWITL